MITEKLLCYGLDDSTNYYVDFHFRLSDVQGWFMADEENISLVIGGQIYELKYNNNLYKTLTTIE